MQSNADIYQVLSDGIFVYAVSGVRWEMESSVKIVHPREFCQSIRMIIRAFGVATARLSSMETSCST